MNEFYMLLKWFYSVLIVLPMFVESIYSTYIKYIARWHTKIKLKRQIMRSLDEDVEQSELLDTVHEV